MKTLLAAAFAALSIAGPAGAVEFLANGDFDAGATGFYSDYHHAADHNLWPEGMYDTVSNPASTHRRFVSMSDHTPGADGGRMMVVNGTGSADSVIWAQGAIGGGASLDGAAGEAFAFSFWMATVYPTSPANLQLWVNGSKVTGVTFAALGESADLGIWRQYSYAGVAGLDGLRSIALTNNNLAPFGNDFALDDMSLLGARTPPPSRAPPPAPASAAFSAPLLIETQVAAVPEPASWAMMILGFSAIGAALRRRRTLLFQA